MAETKQIPLMAMERACARKWLEAHGTIDVPPVSIARLVNAPGSKEEFEAAVDALALHIFHYLNGWQEEA